MKISSLLSLSLSLFFMIGLSAAAQAERVSVDVQSLLSLNPAHFNKLFNEAAKLQNVDLYWSKFKTNGLKLCMSSSFYTETQASDINHNGFIEISRTQNYGNPWDCDALNIAKPKEMVNKDLANLAAPTYAIKEVNESVKKPSSTWKELLVTSYQLIDLKTNQVLASSVLRSQPAGGCKPNGLCWQNQVDTSPVGTKKVNVIMQLLNMIDSGHIQ